MRPPLNLQKLEQSATRVRLSLTKSGVAANLQMQVAFVLDVSQSFVKAHTEGTTNQLLVRCVPWAMVFDPNKVLDVFTYSDGRDNVSHVGVTTPHDCEGYIERNIIGNVRGWDGGTDYSYAIERSLQHFGWLPKEKVAAVPLQKPKKSIWKRIFGSNDDEDNQMADVPLPVSEKEKAFIIFITDGEANPSDRERTRDVLRASQERGDKVYFLLIGYSQDRQEFKFLRELADEFSNTGLLIIQNPDEFVEKTDEELNQAMILPELVQWLKQAA